MTTAKGCLAPSQSSEAGRGLARVPAHSHQTPVLLPLRLCHLWALAFLAGVSESRRQRRVEEGRGPRVGVRLERVALPMFHLPE